VAENARPQEQVTSLAAPNVEFSWSRVQAIMANTLTESIRQKIYLVLVLVGVALIGSSNLITAFEFQGKIKAVKDLGLGVMSAVGTLLAIIVTAQYLPMELERKTLYTILSKPARRFEFLLGKYLGILTLLAVTVGVLSVLMAGVLLSRERGLIEDEVRLSRAFAESAERMEQRVEAIRGQIRDPEMFKAVALTLVKLALIAAIALFVSTFSTSMIFTVVLTFMIFLCGMLVGNAKDYLTEHWGRWVNLGLAFIPDLNMFNVADDILMGRKLQLLKLLKILGYGLFWTAVLLFGAHLIFEEKEI
jgi:ABC-type Na+ efflux pump permease subunit